jgi:hypothetical protein
LQATKNPPVKDQWVCVDHTRLMVPSCNPSRNKADESLNLLELFSKTKEDFILKTIWATP